MAQVQTSSARRGNTEAPKCILIGYLSLLKAIRSGQQRLLVAAVSSHLEESSTVSIKDPYSFTPRVSSTGITEHLPGRWCKQSTPRPRLQKLPDGGRYFKLKSHTNKSPFGYKPTYAVQRSTEWSFRAYQGHVQQVHDRENDKEAKSQVIWRLQPSEGG